MVRVVLALEHVGLGVPLQDALVGVGLDATWDASAAGGPGGEPPPDVVVLDGDRCGAELGDAAAAWRALDPAPGVIAIGHSPAAVAAAALARVTLVPPTAEPAAVAAAIDAAGRLRFTATIDATVACRLLGLPAGAAPAAIVAAGRDLDVELARAALRWYAGHYVAAGPIVDELRAERALIVPEIEQVAHLDGTVTLQRAVRRGPLAPAAAARLIWSLAAVGAVTLTAEPPDRATTGRRALAELRDHLRARAERLARATFYDVLEVTPFAEVDEIERAVDALAARYGPERTAALDLGDTAELATAAWEQVVRARKVLIDVAARARYNDWLHGRWSAIETTWAIDGHAARDGAMAFARAQQALATGDVHRALSDLAGACRAHAGHPDYEAGLAWSRYRVEVAAGKDRAAMARRERAVAERAVAGTRPWPRALLAVALLCAADGDADTARWHLREALSIDPSSPAARALMARLAA